jgi:hypothetical protein
MCSCLVANCRDSGALGRDSARSTTGAVANSCHIKLDPPLCQCSDGRVGGDRATAIHQRTFGLPADAEYCRSFCSIERIWSLWRVTDQMFLIGIRSGRCSSKSSPTSSGLAFESMTAVMCRGGLADGLRIHRRRGSDGMEDEAGVSLSFEGLCFNLGANSIPATAASEREAGQRRHGHTLRA